jgi:uncharacterized protein
MSDVLMTLGGVRFSVSEGAYRTLNRTLEMSVVKIARANRPVARQVLGEDETIEISGVCYPLHRHGTDRVERFRELARRYQPVMLTDGMGFVWGRFLVERVEERGSEFTREGQAQRQEFTIALGAFGEDER